MFDVIVSITYFFSGEGVSLQVRIIKPFESRAFEILIDTFIRKHSNIVMILFNMKIMYREMVNEIERAHVYCQQDT